MSNHEPRLIQDIQEMSNHLRHSAQFEQLDNLARDTLIYRVSATIMTERVAEERWFIKEEPVYTSPQRAFLATLPAGSFRRRFLSYLWHIDPQEPLAKRRVHEVVVKRWVNLPNRGVPQQSVEEEMAFWV